jgi:hypothetical protein
MIKTQVPELDVNNGLPLPPPVEGEPGSTLIGMQYSFSRNSKNRKIENRAIKYNY